MMVGGNQLLNDPGGHVNPRKSHRMLDLGLALVVFVLLFFFARVTDRPWSWAVAAVLSSACWLARLPAKR